VRITIVNQHCVGGGQGEVTRRIAVGMARRGHTVHLVAARVAVELAREPNVRVHHVRVPPVRPAALGELWFMARSGAAIRRAGLDGTVIHAHGDVTLARHSVNTCHFVHGTFRRVTRDLRLRLSAHHVAYHALHARLERLTFRRCDGALAAVSGKVERELVELGEAPGRIRVIHHGVDVGQPPSRPAARRQILGELGLPRDSTILLFAGELTRSRKGLGTLLEAMALLDGKRNLRLVVAGQPAGATLVGEVARLGIGDRVVFCGFRRDLPTLMAGADVFVLPTRYDTFGLVILEAQAVGTPVVVSSSRYCGAAELIADGQSGLLLRDPTDPVELRDAVLRLIEDPDLRRRMGEAGEALASAFTWDRAVRSYEELYAQLDRSASGTAAARPANPAGG
jgi:glycosyltransferase involved in cell wall biosynthesis